MADIFDDEILVDGSDEVEDTAELTDAAKHKYEILRNVYIKLDSLPLSFGIPQYSDEITDEEIGKRFKTDLADTLRETGLKIENIERGSVNEMRVENRILYYAIKRFRLTAATFFKFSTAVDGKTVDKTQVPKMLKQILDELDEEYKKWNQKGMGKLWNREHSLKMKSE